MDCSLDSEHICRVTYAEFQVNIFSNNRDIKNVKAFACNDEGIAIPWDFSENTRAKKTKAAFLQSFPKTI